MSIIFGGPVPGIIIGTVLYILNKSYNNETLRNACQRFIFINIFNFYPFIL